MWVVRTEETETKEQRENLATILVETIYRKSLKILNYPSLTAKQSQQKSTYLQSQ